MTMTDVSKSADGPTGDAKEPKGIGGWLILPMLGTLISPLLTLYGAYASASAITSSLSGTLIFFIVIEVLFNLGLAVGWIVAAVDLFRHKRRFPKLYVGLLIVTLVGVVIDLAVAALLFSSSVDASDVKQVVRTVIQLAIWGPYMAKSTRVKNTFVEE
jgi:hypothetical protein